MWDTLQELKGKRVLEVMSREQYENPEEVAMVVRGEPSLKGRQK